jgi:pimeloyl-ACP methyl ester carboxylesterase
MSQTSQRVVLETLSYLATQDLTDILPQIATPTMILVGENSVGNTPDRIQQMAGLLPNAQVAEIPGAGGYVQHSAPEKCVTAWREFIGNLSHQPDS